MERRPNFSLDQVFAILEIAAAGGMRCPIGRSLGIHASKTSILARAGRIRIKVFAHNYRVVTILTGPHAGKSTAPPPSRKLKPYLTIGPSTASKRRFHGEKSSESKSTEKRA